MYHKVLILLFFVFSTSYLFGQKWVADTLTINFGTPNDSLSGDFCICSVDDERSFDRRFISIFEHKKALVFPVDQVVQLKYSLSKSISNSFSCLNNADSKYRLAVKELYATNSISFGKQSFNLYASIELYSENNSDSSLLGSLYYENKFSQKKKEKISTGYEKLIDNWKRDFFSDVSLIHNDLYESLGNGLYHYRKGQEAIKRNFYVQLESFYGINIWGIDGAVWFSEPERNHKFKRQIGVLRYVNHPTFQSFGAGRDITNQMIRLNEKWVFSNETALVLGINNFKDMKTVAHKFEEIILCNLWAKQRLQYNTIDETGLVFGIGLLEDAHYIVYHKPKIKFAMVFNCAYKF